MQIYIKRRVQLLGIVLLFAAPLVIALLLNLGNWQPTRLRNFGKLIDPPQDVSQLSIVLDDGTKLNWRDPHWQWTLLALSGPICSLECRQQLDGLHRARLSLNQNSDRLRIVYLGPLLEPATFAALAPILHASDNSDSFASWRSAQQDAITAALVDPNGLLLLHYPAGYDANGLRKDLARLIH